MHSNTLVVACDVNRQLPQDENEKKIGCINREVVDLTTTSLSVMIGGKVATLK